MTSHPIKYATAQNANMVYLPQYAPTLYHDQTMTKDCKSMKNTGTEMVVIADENKNTFGTRYVHLCDLITSIGQTSEDLTFVSYRNL